MASFGWWLLGVVECSKLISRSQGANGSGKTTLLALLTGEHPLSFAQRGSSSLTLFGRPRHTLASADLARRIGRVGTEMGDATPRVQERTVWQVVGTGFEGSFVPRGKDSLGVGITDEERERRNQRMWEVLRALGPASWLGKPVITDGTPDELSAAFTQKAFVDCSPGERALVLLARALVGRPGLIILDEAWAGMDSGMVEAARRFLRSEAGVSRDQAVIVVSHWAEEVPWTRDEGLKSISLDEGKATILF
jgi:ABC-type molybdenum transport system ATPase subunit/photorepair protein PhrA